VENKLAEVLVVDINLSLQRFAFEIASVMLAMATTLNAT